ncbi:hypothetical protein BZA77DRAFT_318364 [Pyronema omphalodes]|nr:hypothetical protein BZA77DRAFT_318364 [Pyronema omphalodes]
MNPSLLLLTILFAAPTFAVGPIPDPNAPPQPPAEIQKIKKLYPNEICKTTKGSAACKVQPICPDGTILRGTDVWACREGTRRPICCRPKETEE